MISVSSVDSVDSVAIYHDFDLSKRHSVLTLLYGKPGATGDRP